MAIPASALAQDDETEDRIVVTGFRSSLGAALQTKRDETSIVDAIVAEDIADFPDLNLAESLQRIPGVSIDRQAGEGRRVTVRGLGGDFTRVRINGMEALTTNGGSDASGGSNRSRAFDFNTFASELFNELVVRKSQSASVEEGSLGANVELKTAQPFDYGAGWTGSVSGQAFYNDLSDDVGPRLAGLVSYTNPSETWGVLLSAAYTERTIREEGFSTVRFDDQGVFRSVGGVPCMGDPLPADCQTLQNAYYARIPRYGRLDYEQERLGLTGSMQFRPSDRTVLSIDGLYSNFDGQRDEEFLEVFIRSNTDNVDVTDFTVDSNGVLTRLVGDLQPDVSNGLVPARSEHRRDFLSTEFYQFTGNLEHEFSDRMRGNIFGGISRSDFDVPTQATIFFDAANPVTGYTYDFTGNPNAAFVDFGSMDVNSPSSFLFTQFRNRPQGVDNTYDTIQSNLEYDLNDNITMKGGVSWKRFEFSTFEARAEGSVADLDGFEGAVPVTSDLVDLLTGFGSGLDAPSGIDTSWVSADFDASAALIDLFNIPAVQRVQDTRGVVEKDLGGYVQFDFNFDMNGIPVRGDFGVRYVETRTASTGVIVDENDELIEVTVDRKYDDWLPAFNVVLEPGEDFLIRAGFAQVMARPSLGNLTPGGSIDTFTGPPYAIEFGNPGLDPFRATNLDLSFEWYFAEESLLAVGLFYKDVGSFFTETDTIETTFSQSGLPASVASPTSPLGMDLAGGADPDVEIEQVVNGDSAKIKGLEFIYQQPFSSLPGPFGNTGFIGNYTYVSSDEIIGFSDHAFNATFYYEDNRLGARVTGAYRSDYLTTNPRSSDGREERGVASTFNLDFAMQYALTDSIELTFDALNLTDQYEHQTFDMLGLPTLYHHTGRNFLFGARYNF
ncbi:TonB-dependent receptor [Hyphococcus flavus]|uniref:TonB-dependent receptor n=1 Tax=Hyphococcus flavus TaxID=1866326 RepID=A0AAE9Z9Y3_9PROT|nr:TonB-dependent receptor [Hyphococcus flavus]WDI30079.1 TonB-dependent receptor [Hyphococcus flavus]